MNETNAETVSLGEFDSARLAAIVSSSNDAIVSKNLNGIVNSWNATAERIFGYSAEEMIGRSILTIIPPELHAEEDEIIARIRSGERLDHFDTVRLRRDGSKVDVSLTVSPLRNARGDVIGASKIARDITERKRDEELKSILVNELNHRTKNLLTTVQTIARRTFADHPECAATLTLFERRVHALTVSQDLLTQNAWKGASLASMVRAVLKPFATDFDKIHIDAQDDPHLSLRQTNALSMAIHELATNALKYGALSNADGRVMLGWNVASGIVSISWQEFDGPLVTPPRRTGFGSQMIQKALRHELDAKVDLDFSESGLRCSIVFAL